MVSCDTHVIATVLFQRRAVPIIPTVGRRFFGYHGRARLCVSREYRRPILVRVPPNLPGPRSGDVHDRNNSVGTRVPEFSAATRRRLSCGRRSIERAVHTARGATGVYYNRHFDF